jgi:RNA recognition motif-containing protein
VKLFVRNLPWSATEADLAKFLDDQGYLVTEIKIAYDEDMRRSRGYGFVTFATSDMFQQALRDLGGQEFGGRELYVAAALEKQRNGGSRGRRARREARSVGRPEGSPPDDFGWEDVS